MDAAAARRKRVIPKTGKGGVSDRRLKPKTFRPTEDTAAYLDEMRESGQSETETINRALRIVRALGETLGVEWYEVERRAKVGGVSEGDIVGAMVLGQLKVESKGRKSS